MDAFDADVLIYAAVPGHPLGRRVAALFPKTAAAGRAQQGGIGSLLLLPEVLGKPMRDGANTEVLALSLLLVQLDLRPVDRATAELAAGLAARGRRLRAADAVHLATALVAGADRFVTNNRRDFRNGVPGIEVVYPDDLPDPAGSPVDHEVRDAGVA